jgi:MATE family multidrug resistance protein
MAAMSGFGLLYGLAGGFLAGLYTSDPAVGALAAALIGIAGAFQVFDGIQVVSIGILRGAADTRVPAVVNLVGYWVIGLPLGAWLGIGRGLGPQGLWWGLTAGLASVAVLLLVRVRRRFRGHVARVERVAR